MAWRDEAHSLHTRRTQRQAHITNITCMEATQAHADTDDNSRRSNHTRWPLPLCLLGFLALFHPLVAAVDSSTGIASPATSGLVGVSFLFHLQLATGFGLLSNATQFQLVFLRDLTFVLEGSFQIQPAQERVKITSMESGFYASSPGTEAMSGCVRNRAVRDTIGWASLDVVILPSSDPQLAYIDGDGNSAVNITDILAFQSALSSSLSVGASASSMFCAASFRNVLLHQLSNVSAIEIVPVYACPNTARFSTSIARCADLGNTVAAHNTGYPAAATDSNAFPSWLKLLVLGATIVVAALCLLALICSCCKRQKADGEEQDEPVEECKEQQEAAAVSDAGAAEMAPAAASSSSSSNLLASPSASTPRKAHFALRPRSGASIHVHLPQAEPDNPPAPQLASPSRADAAHAAAPAAISPRSLARLPTYAQVAYLLKLQEQKQAAAAAAAAAADVDAAAEIPPPPPHPAEEEQDVIQPLGLGDSAASSRAHSRRASRSNLHQQLRQANEAPHTPRASRDAAARIQNSPSKSPGAPVASAGNTPSPGAPVRRLTPRSSGRVAPVRRALFQNASAPTEVDTMPY